MKRGGNTLVCLICVIALSLKGRAAVNDAATTPTTPTPVPSTVEKEGETTTGDGPYEAIWLRNVFNLKPAPEPPPPASPTNTPPPNVDLTGITTIFSKKRALFMVQEPGSPGKPAKAAESYILTENQRQGALEVLEINPKARTVKIKNDGVVSTLTLTNKPMLAAAPAPGTPQNMGVGPPRAPGFNRPGGPNAGGFAPGTAPIPIRPVRTTSDSSVSPQANNYAQQAGYAQPFGGGYQGGYASGATPGLSLPNAFGQTPSPTTAAPPQTAPAEVTAAMLIAQQQAALNANRAFPPAPPTFEGIGLNSGSSGEPTQAPGNAPVGAPPPPGQRVTGSYPVPPAVPGGK